MFIKPKKERSKPKQSKSVKTGTMNPIIMKPNEIMKPDEFMRLSRDYVLEHEKLEILSRDYVIENGINWDDDSDIGFDYWGNRVCDLSGDEEVPFTGLLYELRDDGSLWWYGYYEDGLKTETNVHFCLSGEIGKYSETGIHYEWYENGQIMKYFYRISATRYKLYKWYESGQLKEYSFRNKSTTLHDTYEWYETGEIKKYKSSDGRGYCIKCIEYDEAGNITREIKR